MGRPLNNNLFGNPLETNDNLPVLIFNTAMINNQLLTNVYIEKQLKPKEYLVSNGTISGIVDLVPNDPINNGEACMKVITPDGKTVYAVKIYQNTIECSDGNTYYWNRYNYTSSNDDTIVVNSMVASQYKAANGMSESGGKISSITPNINHQSFSSDPAAKNMNGVGGAGIGATFDISSTNKSLFTVNNVSLINGGNNYKVNDEISIPNVAKIKIKNIVSYPNYIDTYSLTQDKQLYASDVAGSYSLTGGTGVNAKFSCTTQSTVGYQVISLLLANGGSGYKKGDVITTPYGNINILSVNESTFGITAISVTPPDTVFSFDPTAKNVPVTGGSGSGASVNITGIKMYSAASATIASGGSKYTVGDTLTIANCGTILVNTVDTGTHGIEQVTLNLSPTYSSTTDLTGTTITASGGSGVGATFTLTTESQPLYQYTDSDIASAGTGYKVNDSIVIENVATITVKTVTSGGAIETISAVYDTTTYNTETNLSKQTGTGGSGTGATFDITQTSSSSGFVVTNVTVKTSGSQYTTSDVLTTTFGSLNVSKIDNGTGEIKTFTFTSDNQYYSTDVAGQNASSGGSGTGATFNILSTTGYKITEVDVNVEGLNYAVNDVVSVTTYNTETTSITTNLSIKVSAVEVGDYAVSSLSISNKLIEADDMAGADIAVTGGSGKGLTVNIVSSQVTGYKITSSSLDNKGFGYSVGDTLTVTGVGTISVNSIDSTQGIVTAFYIDQSYDSYYTDMSNSNLTVIGGSGSGLTLGVTSIETPQYFISSIELNLPGEGYEVNDTLRIGNAGSILVTGITQ